MSVVVRAALAVEQPPLQKHSAVHTTCNTFTDCLPPTLVQYWLYRRAAGAPGHRLAAAMVLTATHCRTGREGGASVTRCGCAGCL